MDSKTVMLPTLSAEVVRLWLLQVNKDLGSRDDDRAISQLERINFEAKEIIAKLERKSGNRQELINRLCALRKKRNLMKATLLLMLTSHMNKLKEEQALSGEKDVWQNCLDKIIKDVGEVGKWSEYLSDYMDSTHKKILESFPDVVEYAKIITAHDGRPLSDLGAKDKIDLLHIGFDMVVRWVELPPGASEFFKYYSESIKAIGENLGKIEKALHDKYRDHWVTFEHDSFGELVDKKTLGNLINDRVGKLKGRLGEEQALQIVHEAAKIHLLKAYNEAAKRLLISLTTGDMMGKDIGRWATEAHCLEIHFRELCETSLIETPSLYQGESLEDILDVAEKTYDQELADRIDEGRKAQNKWFEDEEKRTEEIEEVIAEKRGIDTWCADKPARDIEDLKDKQKQHIQEREEEVRKARVNCQERHKSADQAKKAHEAAKEKYESAIKEIKALHRQALNELDNKHLPNIEQREKIAENLKKSIEQARKEAFWASVDLEEKELSHLWDKAQVADKKYLTFSDKYDPVREAYQQALLDSTKLLLRSKQGEKISKEELNASEAKYSQLEKQEQEMRETYNPLMAARVAAWEAYNTKKAELEALKTKGQQDIEKQVRRKEEEIARLEQQFKDLRDRYIQEREELTKAQKVELDAKKLSLLKTAEAKNQEFNEKLTLAKKVCDEASQKKQDAKDAQERQKRIELHLEMAKAKECVESIVTWHIPSLLRILEWVTKAERDIHSTLWSYEGLTKRDSANLDKAQLKKKALVLYGESFALAEFIDEIHRRESQRTNFKKSLTWDTRFILEPEADLMRRLVQKDGSQNLSQEHEDFCVVFDDLERGLSRLRQIRQQLAQELVLLRERLAACLERIQTAENGLGRSDPESFNQWNETLRKYEGNIVKRIKTIKSQERNQYLDSSIKDIEKAFSNIEETLNKYRSFFIGELTGEKEVIKLVEELIHPSQILTVHEPGFTYWIRSVFSEGITNKSLITIAKILLVMSVLVVTIFGGRELVQNYLENRQSALIAEPIGNSTEPARFVIEMTDTPRAKVTPTAIITEPLAAATKEKKPSGPGSPPQITGLEFPISNRKNVSEFSTRDFYPIPADGSKVWGLVSFSDPDGDIDYAWFTSNEGSFIDPFGFYIEELESGDKFAGAFTFYLSCTTKGSTYFAILLQDEAGNRGNYSFVGIECK